MATIRELFDQADLDLIFEALEHRRRYYKNRIPQQRTDAPCGGIRPALTLERYERKVKDFDRILGVWVGETT
ncbi:MAG: hypothetical protein H6577_17875 [Lewinellaceae bacterium]|nr:hypothetical protein [Saprospiraceae bacterium]MCB9339995.1 hypothetical protein [Lewinellaceae bacterium]